MKQLSATIIISLMYLSVLTAQHYQTVYSNKIAFFDNQSGNVKCIRIDSVRYDNDSILFPFSNIQQIDYDCFTPYGPSWIGEKVIMNDSMNLFFNQKNDTIKIKINAVLNESWIAYELTDSTKIVARVINFDTLTFLGQLDSVKTIGFQVYDKTMTPLDSDLNDMTISISMNFGFIKTLNFFLFPDFEFNYNSEFLEEYNLIGLSEPRLGIQNLTWFDVYDFQVGDEVHILYESNFAMCGGDNGKSRTIDKYISRSDYPDSIVYEIDREQIIQEFSPESTIEHSHHTIRTVITQNTTFDHLPGEPIVSEYLAHTYTMTNGDDLYKTEPSVYEQIWPTQDSCWTNCCYDGGYCYCHYIKGLGGPYCDCENNFMCFGSSTNRIVYYKKVEKTWGTPLILSDIPDINDYLGIEIYPNPTGEKIWIKIPSSNLPLTFELVDLSGKTLLRREIKAEMTSFKLDEYLKGIYLYRIINENKIVYHGKLLIE
jgi:hypothetical protein